MMKLSEFISLDEASMKVMVLTNGVLIAKRDCGDQKVFLFQMSGYYVETWCNIATKAIEEFRFFYGMEALDPYLEAISIEEVLPQIR